MEVSTPGRICLFGEHQDYLGLPVIALAISLCSRIKGERESGNTIIIHKPDLNETESFSLNDLSYSKPRDYFKSGIKVCQDEGLTFSQGINCQVTSDIPFQAGCSSSSAIMVSWIHLLSQLADNPVNWSPQKMGELAYHAEVGEFGEPGGMMDQYSTAMGDLIYLQSEPEISIESLQPELGYFVLGDSGEPKETLSILKRCKDQRLHIIERLEETDFELKTGDSHQIQLSLNKEELTLMEGTLRNRDILNEALDLLNKVPLNHARLGELLTEQHIIMRDVLQVSTPKIEAMLDAALDASALGGKINGSGGGGCMFAYTLDRPEEVAAAIEKAGGRAYSVRAAQGTRIHE